MRRPALKLRVVGESALLLITAIAVGVSVAHAGYDQQQNRAPAARIALSAAALIMAVAALRSELVSRPGPHRARRAAGHIALVGLSVVLLLAWWIITLSTGKL